MHAVHALRDYWPLLVSSGLLYLEIRSLKAEICSLHVAVQKLAESNSSASGRPRRSISFSTNDDWFSVKSANSDEEEEEEIDHDFLQEVDRVHYSSDKGIRDAWDMLKDKDHSRAIEILWRKTRSQCSMYGQYRKGADLGDNLEMRKHFANTGLKWAEEIIAKAPKIPHGYRYKAAALGCMMEFFSVTDKVTHGKEIRENLALALKCDPTDGSAHYIFGRFHYEASNLPWAVRAVANRIGMPPCSENDALDHFDQAIGSSGHDKELHLYRYKILTKLGRSEEAKAAVESGRSIPITFRSEQPVQDELEKIWTQNYS